MLYNSTHSVNNPCCAHWISVAFNKTVMTIVHIHSLATLLGMSPLHLRAHAIMSIMLQQHHADTGQELWLMFPSNIKK